MEHLIRLLQAPLLLLAVRQLCLHGLELALPPRKPLVLLSENVDGTKEHPVRLLQGVQALGLRIVTEAHGGGRRRARPARMIGVHLSLIAHHGTVPVLGRAILLLWMS